MSSKKKELGFHATASIARLRQIAAEAGDALLTEGYVQRAAALHYLTHAQRTCESRDTSAPGRIGRVTPQGMLSPAKRTRT
jgi:hypothetical protein